METNLQPEISKATGSHCAALMYGTLSDMIFKGTNNFIEQQGTLTFIHYKGKLFGITNQHVVKKAIDTYAKRSALYVFVTALHRHKEVPGRPIAQFTQADSDLPFDLAIFQLPVDFLEGSSKVPIQLESKSQTILSANSMALAVGFPGSRPEQRSPEIMAHQLFHVVGTCRSISDRNIIIQDAFDEEGPPHEFGGMSGGPIFAFTEEGGYKFQGILFEGKGFGDVDDDQEPGSENWVWGFPFTGEILERALEGSGIGF